MQQDIHTRGKHNRFIQSSSTVQLLPGHIFGRLQRQNNQFSSALLSEKDFFFYCINQIRKVYFIILQSFDKLVAILFILWGVKHSCRLRHQRISPSFQNQGWDSHNPVAYGNHCLHVCE